LICGFLELCYCVRRQKLGHHAAAVRSCSNPSLAAVMHDPSWVLQQYIVLVSGCTDACVYS
jgi:hypothetical protein